MVVKNALEQIEYLDTAANVGGFVEPLDGTDDMDQHIDTKRARFGSTSEVTELTELNGSRFVGETESTRSFCGASGKKSAHQSNGP